MGEEISLILPTALENVPYSEANKLIPGLHSKGLELTGHTIFKGRVPLHGDNRHTFSESMRQMRVEVQRMLPGTNAWTVDHCMKALSHDFGISEILDGLLMTSKHALFLCMTSALHVR